jgi:hypothetical protein
MPASFSLPRVVGDPRLAHPVVALELADADPRRVASHRSAEVREGRSIRAPRPLLQPVSRTSALGWDPRVLVSGRRCARLALLRRRSARRCERRSLRGLQSYAAPYRLPLVRFPGPDKRAGQGTSRSASAPPQQPDSPQQSDPSAVSSASYVRVTSTETSWKLAPAATPRTPVSPALRRRTWPTARRCAPPRLRACSCPRG